MRINDLSEKLEDKKETQIKICVNSNFKIYKNSPKLSR